MIDSATRRSSHTVPKSTEIQRFQRLTPERASGVVFYGPLTPPPLSRRPAALALGAHPTCLGQPNGFYRTAHQGMREKHTCHFSVFAVNASPGRGLARSMPETTPPRNAPSWSLCLSDAKKSWRCCRSQAAWTWLATRWKQFPSAATSPCRAALVCSRAGQRRAHLRLSAG